MKKRTIVILCIVGALVVWFVIFLNNLADDNLQDMKDNPSIYTQNISDEYINLIKEKNKVSVIGTSIGKFRNPISDIYYDKKYCVEIYKVASITNLSLKDNIIESHAAADYSNNTYYAVIENGKAFNVSFVSKGPGTFKKIYMNLFGNQTQTVLKNDSILVYNSIFKNFSLRTQPNGPDDMYVKPSKGESLPFEVVFSKKAGNIYMILISAKLGGAPVDTEAYKQILNL